MGMIFQEPMSSFSPVHTIGAQIAEVVEVHERRAARRARATARADAARQGRHPEPDRRARPLSVGVLRRHAPARDDRAGAGLRAERCSSPTSRRPRSTSPSRRRSSTCCARCSASSAWRSCSSPTTSASSRRWPTAWRSCMPAASSRAGRCARSSAARRIPTRARCSTRCRGSATSTAARRIQPIAGAMPIDLRARRPAAASIRAARSPSCRAAPRRCRRFARAAATRRLHPRRGERSRVIAAAPRGREPLGALPDPQRRLLGEADRLGQRRRRRLAHDRARRDAGARRRERARARPRSGSRCCAASSRPSGTIELSASATGRST